MHDSLSRVSVIQNGKFSVPFVLGIIIELSRILIRGELYYLIGYSLPIGLRKGYRILKKENRCSIPKLFNTL